MPWLTLFKHLIPYIWDVFIKQYDEEGNPVLWSKPMILGVIVVLIFLYYNIYSFIHTKTEEEHRLNVKNTELIVNLKNSNDELERQVTTLLKEREEIKDEELRAKATLSEARLDIIQLTERLNNCQKGIPIMDVVPKNIEPVKNTKNKNNTNNNSNKKINDIDLILRGNK